MSMVRSNEAGQVGDLLRDWRRMNVSLTRARSKLVVFGSRKTLEGVPLLNEFFGLMEEKGWIVQLPKGADKIHVQVAIVGDGRADPTVTGKRRVGEVDAKGGDVRPGKENATPRKRIKTEEGVLKGRSILRDLVNGL